jgi:predicted RNA binding protein YcfA (HicA-like mRNA interferase family)
MKLPRDLSGDELSAALGRYGFLVTRQTGSHLRLTSNFKGKGHHITIPRHKVLKTGTLNDILGDVSVYLQIERKQLIGKLFD